MNVLLYEPYNINGSDYNKNARRSPQEAMAENQGCHHKWKEFKLLHILPGQIQQSSPVGHLINHNHGIFFLVNHSKIMLN